MALISRRSGRNGSASAYDTLFVDFAGKVTLRASLDGRSAAFRSSDIQKIYTRDGKVNIQYFSPVHGSVNAPMALTFTQVRDAFMREYGKFSWKEELSSPA